jgi:hypothetical protein
VCSQSQHEATVSSTLLACLGEAGEAWSGGSAGTVALEQLPRLCLPGARTGSGERLERARAEAQKGDNFSAVMILTRHPQILDSRPTKNHVRETWATRLSRDPVPSPGPGQRKYLCAGVPKGGYSLGLLGAKTEIPAKEITPMVKHVTLVLLFVMEVCTLGCAQSTTLTRAKAKDIIENSSAFKDPRDLHLRFPDAGQHDCTVTKELLLGAEEGYWVGGSHKKLGYVNDFVFGELTEKGKKYFKDPPSCAILEWEYGPLRWIIPPVIPHSHITHVTGITGDDRNKKVELEWVTDTNELPGDLRQLFPVQEQPLHEDRVDLTLYDDGWRVVN